MRRDKVTSIDMLEMSAAGEINTYVPHTRHGYDSFFAIRFNSASESFDSDLAHDSQLLSKNWFNSVSESFDSDLAHDSQ